MRFTISNNPADKLLCWIYNKKEELSQIKWIAGKHKECKCRICGDILDNRKDMYSPMQCGWHRVTKYSWICHRCFDHRNFIPFIEMIDESDKKAWEEHSKIIDNIRLKAQEIIDLLKEYLPEYKEILNSYDSYIDLDYYDGEGCLTETNFVFIIEDKNEEYVLEIRNSGILKSSVSDKNVIEIVNYLDEDKAKTCTFENPWTWDDAIEVIKKRINEE